MAKLILGIIGQRLSGKDTVGEYLVEKKNAYQIKYSHILDEILQILDQPNSRRNEIDLGMALRNVFHEGVINAAVKRKLLDTEKDLAVVNGIRFWDEYEMVKALGGKFLYITAPQEILYQRFLSRRQKADDSVLSAQDFLALENEPTEIKIAELGKKCEYVIENTGSKANLYEKIEKILGDLHSNHK